MSRLGLRGRSSRTDTLYDRALRLPRCVSADGTQPCPPLGTSERAFIGPGEIEDLRDRYFTLHHVLTVRRLPRARYNPPSRPGEPGCLRLTIYSMRSSTDRSPPCVTATVTHLARAGGRIPPPMAPTPPPESRSPRPPACTHIRYSRSPPAPPARPCAPGPPCPPTGADCEPLHPPAPHPA